MAVLSYQVKCWYHQNEKL